MEHHCEPTTVNEGSRAPACVRGYHENPARIDAWAEKRTCLQWTGASRFIVAPQRAFRPVVDLQCREVGVLAGDRSRQLLVRGSARDLRDRDLGLSQRVTKDRAAVTRKAAASRCPWGQRALMEAQPLAPDCRVHARIRGASAPVKSARNFSDPPTRRRARAEAIPTPRAPARRRCPGYGGRPEMPGDLPAMIASTGPFVGRGSRFPAARGRAILNRSSIAAPIRQAPLLMRWLARHLSRANWLRRRAPHGASRVPAGQGRFCGMAYRRSGHGDRPK